MFTAAVQPEPAAVEFPVVDHYPSRVSARLGVAFLVATIAATAVHGRERLEAHPSDDTEVFTGGEEVMPGGAPKRPAIAYWNVLATLRVPAAGRPVHVGMLVPLSDGRQDILARRAAAPTFRFRESVDGPNLRAEWTGEGGVWGVPGLKPHCPSDASRRRRVSPKGLSGRRPVQRRPTQETRLASPLKPSLASAR